MACAASGDASGDTCNDTGTKLADGTSCPAVSPSTGACAAGRCVVTLATGQGNTPAVAVDATRVYWVTDPAKGAVLSIPLGGGTPTTLASNQSYGLGITVSNGVVYWTDNGTGAVMQEPVGGGTISTFGTGGYVWGVAASATSVYWASASTGTGGTITGKAIGGTSQFLVASGQNQSQWLALDSTSVYWTDWGQCPSDGGTCNGAVVKAPLAGGAPTTLAAGRGQPTGIATDGTNVYWADSNNHALLSVPVGGGSITTVASGGTPIAVAIDASFVYWTSYATASILKAPLGSSGQAVTLVSSLNSPQAIAVDGTSVYWATYSGEVGKVTPK